MCQMKQHLMVKKQIRFSANDADLFLITLCKYYRMWPDRPSDSKNIQTNTQCVGGEMNLCGISHVEWVDWRGKWVQGENNRGTPRLACEVDQS